MLRHSINQSSILTLDNLGQVLQLDRFCEEHIAATPKGFFVSCFGAESSQSDDLCGWKLVFLLVRADPLTGFVAIHLDWHALAQ
jgi:hypothetical protein